MDSQQFDELLTGKFAPAALAPVSGSIVDDVMRRLELLQQEHAAARGWVIGFALLLGGLVALTSLQGLDLPSLIGFWDWVTPLVDNTEVLGIALPAELTQPYVWLLLLLPGAFLLLLLADY
jgi:hypothetical protein